MGRAPRQPPPGANHARDRQKIQNILKMARKSYTTRDKKISVASTIVEAEIREGSTFLYALSRDRYLVCASLAGEILSLSEHHPNDRVADYLHRRWGLLRSEPYTKFVYEQLQAHAGNHGEHVHVRRFAVYQGASPTVYLSRYDGTMWQIDGGVVKVVTNGSEGVFFLDDDDGIPCDATVEPHGLLLDALTNLSFVEREANALGATANEQKRALTAWIFALAFPDLLPAKPLLLLEGRPGAGKSLAAMLIQLVLLGQKKPMVLRKHREDDFGILLLRNPIALFDNLDAYFDWLPDAVCAYATGGMWSQRRLYTDGEEYEIRPHAFIAVASKNPASFRREDTADRCIVIRLKRRTDFVPPEQLEGSILKKRSLLLGEYLHYVNKIVKVIRSGEIDLASETSRMAGFAYFTRCVGRALGWTDDEVAMTIDSLERERDAFIGESDSLVEVLNKWIVYRSHRGPSNIGRVVPLLTLFQELESIAQANSIAFYHSPLALMHKINSTHIDRQFIVQELSLDGQKAYRIWRRTDPQLHLVTGQGAKPVE